MTSNIQELTVKTKKNLTDLSRFIVEQNLSHHSKTECIDNYESIVTEITKQELKTSSQSSIFIVENQARCIEASIRVLKWNYKDVLPIQKMFGITPFDIIGNTFLRHVYHIGRFAINKNSKDLSLFKKLMICALTPVYNEPNSIVFAECDQKLVRVMKALGIEVVQIGEGIDFLGSIKVPICIYHDGIVRFYEKNKKLVSDNLLAPVIRPKKVIKKVVKTHNYPLV